MFLHLQRLTLFLLLWLLRWVYSLGLFGLAVQHRQESVVDIIGSKNTFKSNALKSFSQQIIFF